MGDAADKLGRGGEEIAREKSERLRGNERGLGGKAEEPVTQTAGGREGQKSVRQTAGEEGKKQGKRDWGEGLEGTLSGPRGGDVPSLLSGAAPSPGEPPPFPPAGCEIAISPRHTS